MKNEEEKNPEDKHRADVLKKAIFLANQVYEVTQGNMKLEPSPAVIAQMFATLLVESKLNQISYRLHVLEEKLKS